MTQPDSSAAAAAPSTLLSPEQLGRTIRARRGAAGLTRSALCARAGVGKTALFDLEHGKATVKLSTVLAVLGALGMNLVPTDPHPEGLEALAQPGERTLDQRADPEPPAVPDSTEAHAARGPADRETCDQPRLVWKKPLFVDGRHVGLVAKYKNTPKKYCFVYEPTYQGEDIAPCLPRRTEPFWFDRAAPEWEALQVHGRVPNPRFTAPSPAEALPASEESSDPPVPGTLMIALMTPDLSPPSNIPDPSQPTRLLQRFPIRKDGKVIGTLSQFENAPAQYGFLYRTDYEGPSLMPSMPVQRETFWLDRDSQELKALARLEQTEKKKRRQMKSVTSSPTTRRKTKSIKWAKDE